MSEFLTALAPALLVLIAAFAAARVTRDNNRAKEHQDERNEWGRRLTNALEYAASEDARQRHIGRQYLSSLASNGALDRGDEDLAKSVLMAATVRSPLDEQASSDATSFEDEDSASISRASPDQISAARALVRLSADAPVSEEVAELVNPDNVLVIRLGAYHTLVDDPDRAAAGYYPGMTTDELRNSTRMWWKMSHNRAARVRYLVAAAQGQVRDVYEVDAAEPFRIRESDQRVSFSVKALPEGAIRQRITHAADNRLRSLSAGAANPVSYVTVAGV